MMATDSIELETFNEPKSPTAVKKPKRGGRRALRSTGSNGIMENGHDSLTESIPTKTSKDIENENLHESTSREQQQQELTNKITNKKSNEVFQSLTPIVSSQSDEKPYVNQKQFEQIDLETVTDEDDKESIQRQNIQERNSVLTERSTIVPSYTSGDNDIIEIHEFSIGDIDAYLDIYFEILNNRLRHFIGNEQQLQEFRLKMKNRITSDRTAPEYQNVLLGKMHGEVVAAVTLVFPGDTTTITNDNILAQDTSCLKSMHRWMGRNANYIPTNMEECYIEMIGVKSAFRNHGIGSSMIECVEDFARQAGATLLTIHISGQQLRNYFERFDFEIDHTDNSAFWKWIVERQSTQKLSKTLTLNAENNDHGIDNTSGYVNESTAGSEDE